MSYPVNITKIESCSAAPTLSLRVRYEGSFCRAGSMVAEAVCAE